MEINELVAKVIEEKIEGQLEIAITKGVEKALDDLFGRYGGVSSAIETKLKEVMVPYVEKYDFSNYVTKLDKVFIEILKNVDPDYEKIIKNFSAFTQKSEIKLNDKKRVTLTTMFEQYCDYASKNIDTDDLEVDYDDEPTFEYFEVVMEVETLESEYSSWDTRRVTFTCEKDESLNVEFEIYDILGRGNHTLTTKVNPSIKSLALLNEFEVFLMRLEREHLDIEFDTDYGCEEIQPDKQPELQEVTYG